MPTITFRVSEDEKVALEREAQQRGLDVSKLVREGLGFRSVNADERLTALESRVERLERVAGL